MILPQKAKEATKTALAMTIAYGIALSSDWDRPYWAGFAVAFCSLATIGQSLNKAALRMTATFVAIAAAFTFIALFAQERWAFILCLSLYGAFCTYMMSGSRHAYFWQASWFVCCVICMDAGPDPVNAFTTGILRAQETGLGILVYSLVAIFLWPTDSRAKFMAAAENLASTQHQLFRACMNVMRTQGNPDRVRDASTQEVQAKAGFDQLLQAAVTDSSEVGELRQQWQSYQRLAAELANTIESWRETFSDVQTLEIADLLPGVDVFADELDGRFARIGDMFAGSAPARAPRAVDLSFDTDRVRQLSHFQRAAFAVARTYMLELDRLSRSLLAAANDIRTPASAIAPAAASASSNALIIPDPDRLANAVRLFTIMWSAFLAVIYINDIPGGTGLVAMAGSLGIAFANQPQLPISKLFAPVAVSTLFAAALYLFVMPHLTSFVGLGPTIFVATFVIGYLFAAPQQALGRTFGLALFLVIASISNEQTYSFLSVAVTAQMFSIILFILAATVYFPFCFIPDRVFLRLLGRYFRSSAYLILAWHTGPTPAPNRITRWRRAFHAREIATLPAKLRAWAPHIDSAALSGSTPGHVDTLLNTLQSLTFRIQQCHEQRDAPQAPFLMQALLEDWRAWHLQLQSAFQRLAQDPVFADEHEALRIGLEAGLNRLESRIEHVLDAAPAGHFSDAEAENFYRLLDAYRGVSNSLIDYETHAGDIDWTRWREERFA